MIKSGTKYEIAGVYETFEYVTQTEVKSIKDIIGSNVPANFVSSDFPIIIWAYQMLFAMLSYYFIKWFFI